MDRTRTVEEILSEFPNAKRDKLIPILQAVQEELQYLSRESMVKISEHLNMPVSKVYGVATFYNQFRFQPRGKYQVQICRGTACHVKNSISILDALRAELKIEPGQTTRDGLFSLEIVACIGACGLAPVIAVNGEFHARVTPANVRKILNQYRKMEKEDAIVK